MTTYCFFLIQPFCSPYSALHYLTAYLLVSPTRLKAPWRQALCFREHKEIKPINPKGNQPWLFIERTGTKAEAPILWPPDTKGWLTVKTLMLGKIEGKRRRGQQRMRWLDGIINSMDMNLSKPHEIVNDREPWHAAVHGVTRSQTQPRDWTTSVSCLVEGDFNNTVILSF